MFNTIKQTCQEYYNQIPADTFSTVAKSALYSFSLSLIITKRTKGEPFDLIKPLFKAGIGTIASLVYALTVPIFNKIFGDNHLLYHRELMKGLVVSSLTSVAATYLTTSKVTLASTILFGFIPFNAIKASFDLFPMFVNWAGDQDLENNIRTAYRWVGIDAVPGSNSICLAL